MESADQSRWDVLCTSEQLDGLLMKLQPAGVREGPLTAALMRCQGDAACHMPQQPLAVPADQEQQVCCQVRGLYSLGSDFGVCLVICSHTQSAVVFVTFQISKYSAIRTFSYDISIFRPQSAGGSTCCC